MNRIPTPILYGKSPYEVLFGTQPKFSHLWVLDCFCFAHNIHFRHKFDSCARKCIFIWYPFGQKGYHLYDLDDGKTFTSRDVIFHESVFPFCDQPAPEKTHPVIPLPIFEQSDSSRSSILTSSLPSLNLQNYVDSQLSTEHSAPPNVPPENFVPPPVCNKSTLVRHTPAYLRDYVCSAAMLPSPPSKSSAKVSSGSSIPLSNYLSYTNFSTAHKILHCSSFFKRGTYMVYHGHAHAHWRDAMAAEIKALRGQQHLGFDWSSSWQNTNWV